MSTMTLTDYAVQHGVKPPSLQRKLKRNHNLSIGLKEKLPYDVISLLEPNRKPKTVFKQVSGSDDSVTLPSPVVDRSQVKSKSKIKYLPEASLIICGLVSSWGCFKFLSFFSPLPVCIVGAFAMVSVYVSLCTMTNLNEKAGQIAKNMSVAAMAVSLLFNVCSIAMFAPGQMSEMNGLMFFALCILRGAPFPVLTYFMSLVIFKLK